MRRKTTIFYLSIVLFVSILVCGCDNTPAGYSYALVVSGLENYTGNGTVSILVPIPVINGSAFFTDENMMNGTGITHGRSEWIPRLITTEKGQMISLSTNEKNLTAASIRLYGNLSTLPYNESERAALLLNNTTLKYPFYPVAGPGNRTPSATSIPEQAGYAYRYDTYVYIDENITPLPGKDHTIRIYSTITIYEGAFSSSQGKSHSAMINETIPGGMKGWVPATVYVR